MIHRRTFLSAGVFAAGAVTGRLCSWLSAKPRQPRTQLGRPQLDVRLALSLVQYQRELRAALSTGTPPPDPIRTLHGLNHIVGILRTGDGDILLVGSHDSAVPDMELDDLLVTLRNAYAVGPEFQGVIGCTIDPTPGVSDPWRVQIAKVFGMPDTAPMGARHVAIDYELKKIAAGLFSLEPRVPSVFETARSAAAPCQAGHENGGPQSATHRFWFTPRYPDSRPRFVDDGAHGVWIRNPILVQVQSEEEFLQSGQRISAGPPHPAAVKFAASVTDLLATDDVPRYSRLRSDFRLVEVARLMRYQKVPVEQLRYLLSEAPLGSVPAPSKVGGIRREESGEAVCDVRMIEHTGPRGRAVEMREDVVHYRQEFRGGVDADVKIEATDFGRTRDTSLAQLAGRVMRSRPQAAAAWGVPS